MCDCIFISCAVSLFFCVCVCGENGGIFRAVICDIRLREGSLIADISLKSFTIEKKISRERRWLVFT